MARGPGQRSKLSWEEQTHARLERARARLVDPQAVDLAYWRQYAAALARALQLAQQEPSRESLTVEELFQLSVPKALIRMAEDNAGMLSSAAAIGILLETGYYTSRERAAKAVYSALQAPRCTRAFVRVRSGVYRLRSKVE